MSYVVIVSRDEGPHRRADFSTGRYHTARRGLRKWLRPSYGRLFRRGATWHRRHLDSGNERELTRALRDLAEAVWGRAPFLAAVRTNRRRWPEIANEFGAALLAAHRYYHDEVHLNNAIRWLHKAATVAKDGSPLRADILANLIAALRDREQETDDELPDDYLPSLVELRQELSLMESAKVADRLAAAASWGYEAAATDPAEGLAGLDLAVKLLPRAAWWGQTRAAREELLAGYTGLASDAAACAVAAGNPRRALELLEGGRAVLWTQLLKTRTDRTALHEVAPKLAKRMDRIAAALERDEGMGTVKRMALVRRWSTLNEKAHAKLVGQWESLSAQAQEEVPEGTFTMPVYGPDLAPAGAEGPVVIVNVSAFGCSAVLVARQGDEPRIVQLPDLTYEDARERADRYVTALTTEDKSREKVVGDTVNWLARAVAAPVLDALGPAEDSWPRVWWCPTGPLMTLPLHAAALDRVVSSYTPTLRGLVRARENRDKARREESANRRLLYVAVGDDLPGAASTRAYLEELIPAERRTTLVGDAATPKTVEATLREHAWVHFDCHGVQDLDHPFQGGLVLRGERLTVADVGRTRHDGAELAFLAACATAVGGRLIPDESITLASALHYAGYQNVIGTLWTLPDRSAERMTRSVYDTIVHGGQIDATMSAQALHQATRAERDRMPRHPSAWVPLLHVGV